MVGFGLTVPSKKKGLLQIPVDIDTFVCDHCECSQGQVTNACRSLYSDVVIN
jgi:hypothetical protein